MELGRRTFLKLGAGTAVMGSGCSSVGNVTGGSWLFNPGRLTAAHSKLFARVDYGTLYQVVDEHTDIESGEIATPAGGIDAEELDEFAAVASMSISGNNGVPTGVFASGASGSFGVDVIEDLAKESLDADSAGSKGQYELVSLDNPAAAESSELSLTPETFALGVKEDTAVTGAVRAPEADTESVDAVEGMISAKSGSADPRTYLTNDGDYGAIQRAFGQYLDQKPTFMYGALLDPALVTLSTALNEIVIGLTSGVVPGGGGVADAVSALTDAWVAELAAGGVAGTMDTDSGETSILLFLTYNTASDAEQTGLVQLFNAAAASADTSADLEVEARYVNRNVVIRVTGDTEEILEESQEASVPQGTPTGSSQVDLAQLMPIR